MRIRSAFISSTVCLSAFVATLVQPVTIDSSFSKETHILQVSFENDIKDSEQISRQAFERKKCKICGFTLIVSTDRNKSHFYPIKAKAEKGLRWEDNCKVCKKRLRQEREKKKSNCADDVLFSPLVVSSSSTKENFVALSELQKTDTSEAHNQQASVLSSKANSSFVENCLTEEPSSGQREESVKIFNNFISLLREEYGKVIGGYVYVKNKRSV